MDATPKTNTFNSEGRILQTEYAIKNVSKGGTMVALLCTDGILLFGISSSEKIYKIDSHIYALTCGLFSDSLQLINYARIKSQEYFEKYEQKIKTKALCRKIGQLKQRFTQINSRPFAVAILYAGYDDKYVLYSTDPSGTVTSWKAKCYGENQDKIYTSLKNEFNECSLQEATFLLFEILKKNVEIVDDNFDKYEVLWFKKDGSRFLTSNEIKTYF
ncbi:putative proteasome subunit alpha type-3 [Dictyocoela muelleri]|nr:putative proteasome subunit alpha type-3 [Dictyocoela muelleri]